MIAFLYFGISTYNEIYPDYFPVSNVNTRGNLTISVSCETAGKNSIGVVSDHIYCSAEITDAGGETEFIKHNELYVLTQTYPSNGTMTKSGWTAGTNFLGNKKVYGTIIIPIKEKEGYSELVMVSETDELSEYCQKNGKECYKSIQSQFVKYPVISVEENERRNQEKLMVLIAILTLAFFSTFSSTYYLMKIWDRKVE